MGSHVVCHVGSHMDFFSREERTRKDLEIEQMLREINKPMNNLEQQRNRESAA